MVSLQVVVVLLFLMNYHSKVQESAARKLNQGVSRKCAEYHFRVPFFGSFLGKQKRTNNQYGFLIMTKQAFLHSFLSLPE